MRIYIIRHADPDYANNTITPEGHLEAKALARRLAREGLDRIYSSPMGRAMHTMQYTAEALGMEAIIEDWTKEISELHMNVDGYGRMVTWNLHGELIRNELPVLTHDSWHKLSSIADDPKVLDIYKQIADASDDFIKRHGYERCGGLYRCIRPNREKIAVFCHGGFGITWLAHLLEIPLPLVWSGFWLPPSSVTTVLFDERTPEWAVPRCIGVADVSHLYEAGLEVLPKGIVANYY